MGDSQEREPLTSVGQTCSALRNAGILCSKYPSSPHRAIGPDELNAPARVDPQAAEAAVHGPAMSTHIFTSVGTQHKADDNWSKPKARGLAGSRAVVGSTYLRTIAAL
jgi:hypothetical protein